MTQNDRLLRYLRTHKSITPMEAWDQLGIYILGARIHDLKKAGHIIDSRNATVQNKFGEDCQVAMYSLHEIEKLPTTMEAQEFVW